MGISVQATIRNPFPVTLDQKRRFDIIHFNSDGDIMVSFEGSTPVKFTSVAGGEVVVRGDTIVTTGTTVGIDLTAGTL